MLLDGDDLTSRTVWAPADSDACIRATVRFGIGAAVECCVGQDQWLPGMVVAHYYREANWPMEMVAPYRVLLDNVRASVSASRQSLAAPSTGTTLCPPLRPLPRRRASAMD